jgi:hypothetical protein
MSAGNQGRLKLAVICSVVCGGGVLLLLVGLRGTREDDRTGRAGVVEDAAERISRDRTGPEGRTGADSSAPGSLPALDTEEVAEPDLQPVTEILKGLPLPGISTTTGNLTNLTPAEEARAIALWKRERDNWSRLRGFSGNLDLEYFDAQGHSLGTLQATVHTHARRRSEQHRLETKHLSPKLRSGSGGSAGALDVCGRWHERGFQAHMPG